MKRLITGAAMLFTLSLQSQTKIDATEKKILAQVDRNHAHSLRLLKELVNINSGTLNVEGVKKTGALLRTQFDSIGFQTEWITLPNSLKRAGHLVASVNGNKGKKLFLIGHLDTVFEPDSSFKGFQMINDSTATGQGVNDMKGGDVIIFAALQSLHELGLLKDVSITAYFTGDEENAGKPDQVSRKDFIERARKHDIALGYEGAQGLNTVATARRGSSSWQLKVSGVQAHSAGVFTVGYGSIYEAARILNEFREKLGREKYLTFNPGLIAGGSNLQYDSEKLQAITSSKTNIISPATVVAGDLRFITEVQKRKAREIMRKIVASKNLLATKAEISFKDGIPAMEPAAKNDALVTKLNEISLAMGTGSTRAGDPGSRGAGDISYIAKYVACIDGLGAMGKGSHAPGETIDLKHFQDLVKRSALLIYRLTR